MKGLEWLVLCRNLLERIHAQEEENDHLATMELEGSEEQAAIALQLEQGRESLRRMRLQFPARMEQAMKAISRLDGMQRKCLWAYYVLGLSNAAASQELRYDQRTFLRRKAEGLKRLERLDKEVTA